MSDQTIVRIQPMGRTGNHMAQLLFAHKLEALCARPIKIEGYDLPDWGLSAVRTGFESRNISIGSHLSRAGLIAIMIDRLKPPVVNIDGVILRISNFENSNWRAMFPAMPDRAQRLPENGLLINVRLGDVMQPSHPNYGPLPISFYSYILEKTGLRPVFMGELEDCKYVEDLQRLFPSALFLPRSNERSDFETLRSARNIVVAVGTFSWFGSFFSGAQTIHLPVVGMLDPRIRPDIDLLPTADHRFKFYRVSDAAWRNRYTDPLGSGAAYSDLSITSILAMKTAAVLRTSLQSSRIHLGLASRLLSGRWLRA